MFFSQLSAHLASLALPDMGTAAVAIGDHQLIVDYNCDGRISWHQTFDHDTWNYTQSAPYLSFEGPATQVSDHPTLAELLGSETWVMLHSQAE